MPSTDVIWRIVVQVLAMLVSVFAVWWATKLSSESHDARDAKRLQPALLFELKHLAKLLENQMDRNTDPVRFPGGGFRLPEFPVFSQNTLTISLLSERLALRIYTFYSELFQLDGAQVTGAGKSAFTDYPRQRIQALLQDLNELISDIEGRT